MTGIDTMMNMFPSGATGTRISSKWENEYAKALYDQLVALQTAAKASTDLYLRPGADGRGVLVGYNGEEVFSLKDAVKYGYLTNAFLDFPSLCQNLDGVDIPDMPETAERAFRRALADFEAQQNAHKEIISLQIQSKYFSGLYLRPDESGDWVLTDMKDVKIPLETAIEKGMVSEDVLKVREAASKIPHTESGRFYLSDSVIKKDQAIVERETVQDIVSAFDYARRSSYFRQVVEKAADVTVFETKDGRLSFIPNNPANPIELPQTEWEALTLMHQFAPSVKVPANVQQKYDEACRAKVEKRLAEIQAEKRLAEIQADKDSLIFNEGEARHMDNPEMTRHMDNPEMTRITVDVNVHRYPEKAYAQARNAIDYHIRKGRIKASEVDAVRSNIKSLEESGMLQKGVDANGNVCSNSDIYTYKMLQGKLLYHPQTYVYKVSGNRLTGTRDGNIADKVGGDHRSAWQALAVANVASEDLAKAAPVVAGMEDFISMNGQANAPIRVARGKVSYNRKATAGYEKATATIEQAAAPIEPTPDQNKTLVDEHIVQQQDSTQKMPKKAIDGSLSALLKNSEINEAQQSETEAQVNTAALPLSLYGQVINLDEHRDMQERKAVQNG